MVDDDASTGDEEWIKNHIAHSVAKTKRIDARKNAKEKGTKTRYNDIKEGFKAIVMARKEYA